MDERSPGGAVMYSFRRCPYAIRARMALAASGEDVELREVLLRSKPAPMLDAGVRGTVPLLVFATGEVLEESLDVMDWCLRRNDPRHWLRHRDDPERQALVDSNDGRFKAALDRYKYPQRYDLPDGSASGEEAAAALADLERTLVDRFVGGAEPDFFDAALFPFVRQFAAVDEARFEAWPLPKVQGWRTRMLQHPAFTRVMKKLPVWATETVGPRFVDTLVSDT